MQENTVDLQTNHHFELETSDTYYLHTVHLFRTDILLADLVLTTVFRPPPLQTSPLTITTHYGKTFFIALVVLMLLYPHIHFGSLWVSLLHSVLHIFNLTLIY